MKTNLFLSLLLVLSFMSESCILQKKQTIGKGNVYPKLLSIDSLEIITVNSNDVIYGVKCYYSYDTLKITYRNGILKKPDYQLKIEKSFNYIELDGKTWKKVRTILYPYVTLKLVY